MEPDHGESPGVASGLQHSTDADEHWADGVERAAESACDFLPVEPIEVDPAEQVLGFFGEGGKQMFDLFAVFELAGGGWVGGGVFDGGLVGVDMTECVEEPLFGHAADNDSASDDSEVGGEGGSSAEVAESDHVTEQEFSEGVGAEIVGVVRGESEAVCAGSLANNLPNKA